MISFFHKIPLAGFSNKLTFNRPLEPLKPGFHLVNQLQNAKSGAFPYPVSKKPLKGSIGVAMVVKQSGPQNYLTSPPGKQSKNPPCFFGGGKRPLGSLYYAPYNPSPHPKKKKILQERGSY